VGGKTRAGDTINVFPNTGLADNWQPPVYLAPVFEGYRWRKYMGRVDGHRNNKVRQGYGRYLCRTHNDELPERSPEQLATFEVWFVKRRTNTTGAPKEVTRKRVWRHWCFPEFKTAL